MNVQVAMKRLKAMADEKVRTHNAKSGSRENQFGVKLGDIRKLAKEVKTDHALALELWETGNVDARYLAILLMKPKSLSPEAVDGLVRSESFPNVADWLSNYVVKKHPEKEKLRERWMNEHNPMASRAGWHLTAERIEKDPDGLDLDHLLNRIESEMADAPSEAQWTMNNSLAAIGIHFPEHRKRAIAIGESLGIYRDYPVSKGCTSPFAPIWIQEMVNRQS